MTSTNTSLVHVPRTRPRYTPEDRTRIVTAVCDRIVQGERIHAACTAEGINWKRLWEWKQNDVELGALYAHAREASGESWEDAATEAADASKPDTVQVDRLKVDTYKWRAAMANPKKFGPKLDVSGEVTQLVGVVFLPAKVDQVPLTPAQARAILNAHTD